MSSLEDILRGYGLDLKTDLSANTNEYNRLMTSIKNGTATFDQVYDFLDNTGKVISNSLVNKCGSSLKNENVPQEVADNFVKPVLEATSQNASEITNAMCSNVNHQNGINVTLQNPVIDTDTVRGMCNKLTSGPYEKTKWIIGDGPVSNLAMHSVDQTIQRNADFITKSGRRARIRRRAEANCCKWCNKLAGEWDYGDEPNDVYHRHNNCRCVVEYIVNGKAQNVWNKSDIHPDQYVHQELKKKYTFRDEKSLNRHYQDHGNEYGDISIDEYVQLANDLINEPLSSDVEQCIRSYGPIEKYRYSTNDFVLYNRNGTLITMFKPQNGRDYWKKQVEKDTYDRENNKN